MQNSTAETARRRIQVSLRVLSAVIRDQKPEPDAVQELISRSPDDLRDLPPDELACTLIRREVALLHASGNTRAMAASA